MLGNAKRTAAHLADHIPLLPINGCEIGIERARRQKMPSSDRKMWSSNNWGGRIIMGMYGRLITSIIVAGYVSVVQLFGCCWWVSATY